MDKDDSMIVKIITFEAGTDNANLDTQLDENATELFDRCTRFATLEENLTALQEGIYGA